jgi:hypothetical protein
LIAPQQDVTSTLEMICDTMVRSQAVETTTNNE